MYCSKDCSCSLCRELRGFKPEKPPKRPAPRPPTASSLLGRFNENFILRKRTGNGVALKNFQPQSLQCSEMCQTRRSPLMAFENASSKTAQKTPSPSRISKAPSEPNNSKDVAPINKESNNKPNHKVVIYFGDSIANRGNKQNAVTSTQKPLNNNNNSSSIKICPESPITAEGEEELPPYIESVQNGIINIKIEGNYKTASALVANISKPTRAKVTKKDSESSENNEALEEAVTEEANSIADSCDWSFVQEWRARYLF